MKRKIRLGFYGKRPRGYHLDHFYLTVMLAYIYGIEDLEAINSRSNCKWLKAAENRRKGPCPANCNHPLYDAKEAAILDDLVKES